jgi:hypothetical protein
VVPWWNLLSVFKVVCDFEKLIAPAAQTQQARRCYALGAVLRSGDRGTTAVARSEIHRGPSWPRWIILLVRFGGEGIASPTLLWRDPFLQRFDGEAALEPGFRSRQWRFRDCLRFLRYIRTWFHGGTSFRCSRLSAVIKNAIAPAAQTQLARRCHDGHPQAWRA